MSTEVTTCKIKKIFLSIFDIVKAFATSDLFFSVNTPEAQRGRHSNSNFSQVNKVQGSEEGLLEAGKQTEVKNRNMAQENQRR